MLRGGTGARLSRVEGSLPAKLAWEGSGVRGQVKLGPPYTHITTTTVCAEWWACGCGHPGRASGQGSAAGPPERARGASPGGTSGLPDATAPAAPRGQRFQQAEPWSLAAAGTAPAPRPSPQPSRRCASGRLDRRSPPRIFRCASPGKKDDSFCFCLLSIVPQNPSSLDLVSPRAPSDAAPLFFFCLSHSSFRVSYFLHHMLVSRLQTPTPRCLALLGRGCSQVKQRRLTPPPKLSSRKELGS